MLDEALLSSDLEDLIDLEEAETLDINGAALLVSFVIVVRVDGLNLFILLEVVGL